jgi:hypothetical protein
MPHHRASAPVLTPAMRAPARDDVMMADMCDVVGVIRLLRR